MCRLLKNEGLVESVEPKGRGTGRTRKGVTWRNTNAGRAFLNNRVLPNKLSDAQKKALSRQLGSPIMAQKPKVTSI